MDDSLNYLTEPPVDCFSASALNLTKEKAGILVTKEATAKFLTERSPANIVGKVYS